jgi:hypothetical protein
MMQRAAGIRAAGAAVLALGLSAGLALAQEPEEREPANEVALECGRVSLTPQVEVDFAREEGCWESAVVFGIAIGFGV